MGKKYYIAYGSNLNMDQMRWRCPSAKIAGFGVLRDWQLRFRGSKTGSYLTIEPHKGSTVPVGVWEITKSDEIALDHYEGYPTFYYKQTVKVVDFENVDGLTGTIDAMVYIMQKDRPLGIPTASYVETCAKGYDDFGFGISPLRDAVERAWKEAV